MKKVDVSVEGLRILRTEGEIVLKDWDTQQPPGADQRRANLRDAVREASKRLAKAEAPEQEG